MWKTTSYSHELYGTYDDIFMARVIITSLVKTLANLN